MKHKLTTFLLIILLIVGVVLVFINPLQQFLMNKMVKELNNISAHEIAHNHLNDELDVSFDFNETASLSIFDVMQAQLNRDDIAVLGSIVVPSVNMQLPIVKGVSKSALAVGAGTMKAEQQMGVGNYALAGHYFENKKELLFSPLYNTAIGDIVYITDKEYVYGYQITKKEIIQATDVHVIEDQAGSTLLTLITCANDGADRMLVSAVFIKKYSFNEMKSELF